METRICIAAFCKPCECIRITLTLNPLSHPFLLFLQPQLLRQRDRSNRNALHYCAAQDSEQTRDLVAAASIAIAAPELLESADEDGFTPLHLAVIQGNLAMVNLLLANKADVNAVDNEGHSVVHWATGE